MSDATIPGGQTAYAGDEKVVRKQAEEAMSEAAPLPVWEYTQKPVIAQPLDESVRANLTKRLNIEARNHGTSYWFASLHCRLTPPKEEPTDAYKLAILREALAEIDAARPVLVRLIEAAEAAGV